MASIPRPERRKLAPDLYISRVVTGLWQIADMEREGRELDLEATARAMRAVRAGRLHHLRHGRPLRLGRGDRRTRSSPAAAGRSCSPSGCPSPGPSGGRRCAPRCSARCGGCGASASTCCSSTPGATRIRAGSTRSFFLEELRAEGLIGHLGAANFDTAHLRVALASGIRLVSQPGGVLAARPRAAGRMSAFCREHGVQLLAYGTLAGGWLTERWLAPGAADGGRTRHLVADEVRPLHRAVGGWERVPGPGPRGGRRSRAHGVSIANVASRADPRPAGGGARSSSARGSANARTSTTTPDLLPRAGRGGPEGHRWTPPPRSRRSPATAATSTAARRS